MERQWCGLFLISGLAFFCPWVSASVLDVGVEPGDNFTVVCDCTCPTGVYTVWYHISQQNQPTQVLKTIENGRLNSMRNEKWMNPRPRSDFLKNKTSACYDLLITNITESDEGLYFCGTSTNEVVDGSKIDTKSRYTYGNASTRILFKNPASREPSDCSPPESSECWVLLYSLCPALTLLCALLLIFVLYSDCHKQGKKREDTSVQMSQNEDDDVCYAALEIRPASQRPKRKKKTSEEFEFSTYSAIKISQ